MCILSQHDYVPADYMHLCSSVHVWFSQWSMVSQVLKGLECSRGGLQLLFQH